MLSIGEKIRERRLELEMTQQELAERVGLKDRSSITKIEKGERGVDISQVELFAKALDLSRAYIMGWEEKPTSLTTEERQLLDSYNSLNNEGKNLCNIQMKMLLKTYPKGEPDGKD